MMMSPGCLTDLVLEEHLLSPEARPLPAHVDGCGLCRSRLAEMREQGAQFRMSVYPRTIDHVLEKGGRTGSTFRWSWAVALSSLVPVAALAVVFALRSTHTIFGEQTQTKGNLGSLSPATAKDLPFTVFVGTPEGGRRVSDGSVVPPDAQLRFRVDPPSRCWFSVVSIDAAGQVSQLYPEAPTGIEVPRASLPGGAILDGRAGPERLFALCSAKPLSVPEVQAEVRERLPASGASVRDMSRLAGVPADVLQGTLLIEKTR
jgi:hypothetical protein